MECGAGTDPRREVLLSTRAAARGEYAAALARVRTDAEDDAPKLVFAEVLERQGNCARAAFLRDAVLCARPGAPAVVSVRELPPPNESGDWLLRPDDATAWRVGLRAGKPYLLADASEAHPVTFAGETATGFRFVPSGDPALNADAERMTRARRAGTAWAIEFGKTVGSGLPMFARGLLWALACEWATWARHGDNLCATQPIRCVQFANAPTIPRHKIAARWPTVEFTYPD